MKKPSNLIDLLVKMVHYMLGDLFELVNTTACGSLSSDEKNGLTRKVFLHHPNALIPVQQTC